MGQVTALARRGTETHIVLNLPKEYQTIVEIREDKIYDKYDPLTIQRVCDKLLVKFDPKNKQSGPRPSREDENPSM